MERVEQIRPDAPPEEFVEIPLEQAIADMDLAVHEGRKSPSFSSAYRTCAIARSVFAGYLSEWGLNRAIPYREKVVRLMTEAQHTLELAHSVVSKNEPDRLVYVEDYVCHNTDRIRILDVLHTQGREAALAELFAPVAG